MANLFNLPFMRKGDGSSQSGQPGGSGQASPEPPEPEVSEQELRLRLYKLIIERYRDMIEDCERKTVTDLKGLIAPNSEPIAKIRDSIISDFHPYIFEQHFPEASKMAFSYVSSFRTISPPVSFWLTFSDMQELMAGDEIDKSILLCSLLRSLGCENAKVLVTDSKKAYVLFEHQGRSFVANHSQKELSSYESSQQALSSLSGKALYAFNDKEYEDFQES
ncbi:MAG: hypothetical protein N3E51_00655 [Candidatus Micrarchaeota archaeon]|nr:hypothetical protein [Candidatus Micrarchaeota archaeon]